MIIINYNNFIEIILFSIYCLCKKTSLGQNGYLRLKMLKKEIVNCQLIDYCSSKMVNMMVKFVANSEQMNCPLQINAK